jgi:hypothetical protein
MCAAQVHRADAPPTVALGGETVSTCIGCSTVQRSELIEADVTGLVLVDVGRRCALLHCEWELPRSYHGLGTVGPEFANELYPANTTKLSVWSNCLAAAHLLAAFFIEFRARSFAQTRFTMAATTSAAAMAADEARAEVQLRLDAACIGIEQHNSFSDFLSIPQRQRDRMEQNFEALRNLDDRRYGIMRNGVAISGLNDTVGEAYDEFFKSKDKKIYFEASIPRVEDKDWFFVEGDVYDKYQPIFTHCEEQFHTRRDVLGIYKGGFNLPVWQETPFGLQTHVYCMDGKVRESCMRHVCNAA